MVGYHWGDNLYGKAEQVYGSPLPKDVQKRLEWEIEMAETNHFEGLYQSAAEIVEKIPVSERSIRGAAGCSLIVYLLGISDIDPIQYNLQPEFFTGLCGDKPPDLSMNVACSQYYEKLRSLEMDEGHYREACDNHLLALRMERNFYCELMQEMNKELSGLADDVCFEDESIQEYLNMVSTDHFEIPYFCNLKFFGDPDVVKDLIEYLHPQTFDDYVKIFTAAHGTGVWDRMQRELVRAGLINIEDFIASGDDVYDFLIHTGLDREKALKYSEAVRKGKGVRESLETFLTDRGVPAWKIMILNEIKYLFPRAHGISYMKMFCRLIYYRMNYSDLYISCAEKISGDFGESEFTFDSHNLNGKLMISTDSDVYGMGEDEYQYYLDVYGDIGLTELDIIIRGTVPLEMIAKTYRAIVDMQNGRSVTNQAVFHWGQLEFWLTSEKKRELRFMVSMDEDAKDEDNYLVIKIPDLEICRLSAFLENAYKKAIHLKEMQKM